MTLAEVRDNGLPQSGAAEGRGLTSRHHERRRSREPRSRLLRTTTCPFAPRRALPRRRCARCPLAAASMGRHVNGLWHQGFGSAHPWQASQWAVVDRGVIRRTTGTNRCRKVKSGGRNRCRRTPEAPASGVRLAHPLTTASTHLLRPLRCCAFAWKSVPTLSPLRKR